MRPYGPAALRLCVGAVFVAHGAQKLFGAWGGPGLSGTSSMLGGLGMPLPYVLAIVLAVTEFGGGILLLLGGLTTWVSLALAIDMAVAIAKVHYPNGFFISGGGAAKGPGTEYALVLLGALVCLMLTGPGAISLDEWRNESAEARALGRARARKV
jgi:putative oxidoreductase